MPKRNRFSDVKRGARLNQALTTYLNRISNPPPPDPGSGGARPPRTIAGVRPFGLPFDSQVVLVTRPTTLPLLETLLVPGQGADLIAAGALPQTAAKLAGFSPAKVTIQYGARSVSTPTSEFTGLPYLKYNNLTREASPFGRATQTDQQFETFNRIRAEYISSQAATEIKRISFQEEDFLYSA